jgi:hypothetical protein
MAVAIAVAGCGGVVSESEMHLEGRGAEVPAQVVAPSRPAAERRRGTETRARSAPHQPQRVTETRARSAPHQQTECNEQQPQTFLMRHTYVAAPNAPLAEREARKALHRAALEYRSRHYGRLPDMGDPAWNEHTPRHFIRLGTFFGQRVWMNEQVLTALGCVEETIRLRCRESYTVQAVSGWRERSTFTNGEVSNHNYGIAIDLDPGKNPCCGCVPAISDRPLCRRPVASPFDRTPIPKCWVDQFERFGFYWLGYDALEDTMHFEFLGDPERIRSRD